MYVCDYRRSGSVAILSSLLSYHNGQFGAEFMQSMLEFRLLIESETARLAALNRTSEQVQEFERLLEDERGAACTDSILLTELDFSFHLNIAIASANLVYPLIINSFKGVYTSLSGRFFRQYCGSVVVAEVHQFHRDLVRAVELQKAEDARQIMIEMLRHGERYLKGEFA